MRPEDVFTAIGLLAVSARDAKATGENQDTYTRTGLLPEPRPAGNHQTGRYMEVVL